MASSHIAWPAGLILSTSCVLMGGAPGPSRRSTSSWVISLIVGSGGQPFDCCSCSHFSSMPCREFT
eukprot:7167852-Lingulodinium_polyedra.AAC.1